MLSGVALALGDLPEALAAGLGGRVYRRGGEAEVRFLVGDPDPLLPVLLDGRLRLVPWGNRDGRRALPRTAWARIDTLAAGEWGTEIEPAVVPAALALDKGVWFHAREGVRIAMVGGTAFVLVEPSTHYYQVMTRSEWMPCLVGEVI